MCLVFIDLVALAFIAVNSVKQHYNQGGKYLQLGEQQND